MAVTYQLIASTDVGAGGATYIDFTSIPQTYTDLKIVLSARFPDSGVWAGIQLNGATNNFNAYHVQGNGSSPSGFTYTAADTVFLGDRSTDTGSVFGSGEAYIYNYTNSTYGKVINVATVNENNGTTAYQGLTGFWWTTTSAITSIRIYPQTSATFVQYSSAYLYGIKNS